MENTIFLIKKTQIIPFKPFKYDKPVKICPSSYVSIFSLTASINFRIYIYFLKEHTKQIKIPLIWSTFNMGNTIISYPNYYNNNYWFDQKCKPLMCNCIIGFLWIHHINIKHHIIWLTIITLTFNSSRLHLWYIKYNVIYILH